MIDKYNVNNDTKFQKDPITGSEVMKENVPKTVKMGTKMISKNGNIYNQYTNYLYFYKTHLIWDSFIK